jgi:cytochrome c-type biogenesis protein CcmF
MLTDLGQYAVYIAFAACFYAAIAAAQGLRRNDDRLIQSARMAALSTFPLVTIGCIGLWYALITHDFGVNYVAETSNRATPLFFRITALWGSQKGSILFWCFIMAGFVFGVMVRDWDGAARADKPLLPGVILTSALTLAFFLFLELFLANAFERTAFPPRDGRGLNPLLRHPGMIIHPPMLYAGYTGMLVPFAFCIASLLQRRGDDLWLRASRRWTLVGWAFLTAGLILGGRWAHDVLGWGGWWGWDPSENMPLITWLIATAFVHSQMIQEKRGMFKNWNVLLMLLSFSSMFFGTAYIRSGLLTSVHAFAASDIGPYFLGALAVMLMLCMGLWLTRLDALKSDHQLNSAFSREGIFLLQNVLFVSTAFTIFIGTIFPILSEAVIGEKITVGPPFFNQVAGPQLLVLVLLMGVAPLMAWGKANARALGRFVWLPALFAVVVMALVLVTTTRDSVAVLGLGLCAYTLLQTLMEYVRGVRARIKSGESLLVAAARLISKNQRRYGGYFVHLGVVVMTIGALGKGFLGNDVIRNVKLNESFTVQGYTFTYRGIGGVPCEFDDCVTTQAGLLITDAATGRVLGQSYPHRDFYQRQQHTATIPDVSGTFNNELYVLLAGWDDDGASASFQVYINPLINYIWLGGILMIVGFFMAFWKIEARERVWVQARAAGVPAK